MLMPTSGPTQALSLSLRVAACCAVGVKSELDGDGDKLEREDSGGSSASLGSSSNASMMNPMG